MLFVLKLLKAVRLLLASRAVCLPFYASVKMARNCRSRWSELDLRKAEFYVTGLQVNSENSPGK